MQIFIPHLRIAAHRSLRRFHQRHPHESISLLNWNQLGTLGSLGITDPFNSTDNQTCTYAHDDLARIASANCGSVWSQTFSYDAFGNLNKNGTQSFQPIYSATTNQMTSIGGSIPSYDADGNVLNDFLHTYSWDANGRPVTIDGIGITYDALGRVVEQNRSGSYTEIAYMPTGAKLALMNGQTLSRAFVPLAGGAAAVYTATAPLDDYRHSDWLGNLRLASQPYQAPPWSETAYAPFGEPYAQAGAADVSFTGMNQDTTSNLYDFPAREYGIQGRWPSPDPAGTASVNPADPQTWDRYAYVRNSPLEMTDPTGMDGEDPGGGTECDPDFGCIDCGIYLCGGGPPVNGPELPPLVTVISSSGPVSTTGLPSILANGPGFDYSWLGLLTWAGILSPPCTTGYISCIENWHLDPNGLIIGNRIGEQLCNSDGGSCQNYYWDGAEWDGYCDFNPGTCYVFGRAAEIASPENIFTVYAGSLLAGSGVPFLSSASSWLLANPLAAVAATQCLAGAVSATPIGGSLPPGLTGFPGNVCKLAVKGGTWIYNQTVGQSQ